MSDETRALYERFLVDLPYDQADVTIDDLIATTMKLPTISRVRRSMMSGPRHPDRRGGLVRSQSRQQDVHELVHHVINLMGGSYNIRTSEIWNSPVFASFAPTSRCIGRQSTRPWHKVCVPRG